MRAARLALALLLTACGDRTLPATDGGLADGPSLESDGAPGLDVPGADGACVRPPGGCFSSQDCPAGQECKGCFADPCCPMCAVCYGRCAPSSECWSNVDCAPGDYCAFADADCGKTKPGTCTARPAVCPDGLSPCCGCDGKTYLSSCDANAAGVTVAAAGACNQAACESLNQAYVAALQSAKACCPMCAALQCVNKVESDLACHGCLTHVNDTTKLNALAAQWKGLSCDTIPWGPCPGMTCPPEGVGVCDGASSTCQDTWPTP